ncbi:hypothetical protein [Streptomyces virginiae]
MTLAPAEALHDLAHRHLPPDDAARWIGLLTPGLRLAHAGDGPPVGRLGGLPELPLDPDIRPGAQVLHVPVGTPPASVPPRPSSLRTPKCP